MGGKPPPIKKNFGGNTMTEKEYNIEVLCISYSLDELISQQSKMQSSTNKTGDTVLLNATLEELEIAIATYDNPKYKYIRDDIEKYI